AGMGSDPADPPRRRTPSGSLVRRPAHAHRGEPRRSRRLWPNGADGRRLGALGEREWLLLVTSSRRFSLACAGQIGASQVLPIVATIASPGQQAIGRSGGGQPILSWATTGRKARIGWKRLPRSWPPSPFWVTSPALRRRTSR